jgi:hypothetical protein
VGISRDYPRKIRTSKQPIGKIPGYKIIPSHPLKYPRSKQGLSISYLSYHYCFAQLTNLLHLTSFPKTHI